MAGNQDLQLAGGHPHRSPRVRTLIRAVIGGEGRPGEDVIVRNVSPGGMCVASQSLTPECGETLSIALPGQSYLDAQVRWVGRGEFGIQLTGGHRFGLPPETARRRAPGFAGAIEKMLGKRPDPARARAAGRLASA